MPHQSSGRMPCQKRGEYQGYGFAFTFGGFTGGAGLSIAVIRLILVGERILRNDATPPYFAAVRAESAE